jgi:hypothetical protein
MTLSRVLGLRRSRAIVPAVAILLLLACQVQAAAAGAPRATVTRHGLAARAAHRYHIDRHHIVVTRNLLSAFNAASNLTARRGFATLAAAAQPPVTAGLQLWFDASSQSYGDSAPVPTWNDRSGLGRDLTAFDSGSAPTFRANAVNGLPAIEFNGSQSLMKTYGSTFTIAQPDTFFIVYRSLDPNTSTRAFVFDSRNSLVRQVFGRPSAGANRMYANIDMDQVGVTYPFPSFQIWSGVFNGASSTMSANGTQVHAGNSGASAMEGFAVGGLSTGGQYGYDLSHSLVAEILVYSGAMSPSDQAAVTSYLDQKYNVLGPPTPPTNTSPPSITGVARDGSTLTAQPGSWSGSQPISYAYAWSRCDSSGSNCVSTGVTSQTYTLASADVGSTFKVTVTASNTAGSASLTAGPTAVVAAAPPSNSSLPSVTGTLQAGSTLTAQNGQWNGTQPLTYGYLWQRCDSGGANCVSTGVATSTYLLSTTDVGSTMRVVVTATNSAGNASATSTQTLVVAAQGGGSTQPPVTSGLQLWYEADGQPLADGQAVTRWADESGAGRDLTAFDSTAAPVFHRNAVNGRAAIEFNGSQSLMKTYGSTFTIAQPDTFFIVYRDLDGAASTGAVFDSRNSSVRQVFGHGGSGNANMYANIGVNGATSYPFTGFQLWDGTFNGAASTMSMNGTQIAAGNAGGSALDGFTVGGLNSSGQWGYNFTHFQVAEILVYSAALTAQQTSDIRSWLNQKYQVLTPPTAPANSNAPTISGNAVDGATLNASQGTWTGTQPISYSYQWQRCTPTCTNIANQTAAYTVGGGDIGATLRVVVTATNAGGSASAPSVQTATVVAAAPQNNGVPTISGTAQEGVTLQATNGTWTGTQPISYAYQWRRCDTAGQNCNSIGAPSTSSYTLVTADVGSTIRVAVTASNSVGSATAVSAATATVLAAGSPPPPGQPPVTTGLQLWYEANTEPYANGAAVTHWTDKSGFGRDLTAFDSSAAATFRTNAINGHAAVEFDGVHSMLKTYGSTFTIAQPDTYFIVYKSLDTGEAYIYDSRNSLVRQLLGRGPNTDVEMYADIDLIVPNYTWPFANYELWSGTYNGANSTLYKNGNLMATGSTGNTALEGFTLGGLNTGTAQYGYLFSHSLVAEVLYYSGSLSTSDRQAVTSWLLQKYGL